MSLVKSRRIRCLALGVVATLLGVETQAQNPEYPQNIGPIELQDVRWQILPQAVTAVFVGSDDRIWYQLNHPPVSENLATVRQVIKSQFNNAAPQLFGAEPALFETNGRVWFRTHSRKTLLGYDGHSWLERSAGTGVRFTGNCPRHGRVSRSDYNVEAAGTVFFPDECGVHTFDGQSWSYQDMGATTAGKRIVVRAEPMGRGVIAVNPGALSQLWYYRDGQWRQENLTETGLRDILPDQSENGVWLSTTDDGLRFHRFGGSGGDIPEILPAAALYTAVPPKFRLLHCDSTTGRCFFMVEQPPAEEVAGPPELLILNDGNTPILIPNYQGPAKWNALWDKDSGPIFTPDHRSVWVPGQHDMKGCDRLDLATGALVDKVPDDAFFWVHAVHSDGTVFINTSEPGQGGALAAYRPGAPAPANMLDVRTFMLGPEPANVGVCVDSTGEIWAMLREGGLSHFDGTQWHDVPEIPSDAGRVLLLLPGQDGRIIIETDTGFYYRYFFGYWRITEKFYSLRDFIACNLPEIVAHYQTVAPEDRCHGLARVALVADKTGNVWYLEHNRLWVFTGDRWQDTWFALRAAGWRTPYLMYLNTVGGSGKVYVTDYMMPHDEGGSFFVSVENGEIVATKAPHCTNLTEMTLSVRDHEDALWIPGGLAAGMSDFGGHQWALRLGETGVMEELVSLGWALLCDASGTVWMGRIEGEPDTRFNLWHAGAIQRQVDIPFDPYRLFSDREGSVYVWTKAGFYHLTASASPGSTDYVLSEYYLDPALPGSVGQFTYSEKGFIVMRTYSNDVYVPRVFHLVLIPLPTSP